MWPPASLSIGVTPCCTVAYSSLLDFSLCLATVAPVAAVEFARVDLKADIPFHDVPPTSGTSFVRGDINGDGAVEMTDALTALAYLFQGGGAPRCLKAADVNDDGTVEITDPVALLGFLFLGDEPPLAPFPDAGLDLTADTLPCPPLIGVEIAELPDVDVLTPERIVRLRDHEQAVEVLSQAAELFQGWAIDVALLDGMSILINDCLGLKVSVGVLALRLNGFTFEIDDNGIELDFRVDRTDLTAIEIQAKPSLRNGCGWGKPFEIGGTAKDVQIRVRFALDVHVDDCHVPRLTDAEVFVRVGSVDLRPLPNALDEAARKIVEESLTFTLKNLLPGAVGRAITGGFVSVVCRTKYALYRAYMTVLGAETHLHRLPEVYIDRLASYFPNVDLRLVRFGFSDNQPANNATTDCLDIYFNDREMVDLLRAGSSDIDWHWLLHELRHTEQCAELGSREDYAKRWFRDLEIAVLAWELVQDPIDFLGEIHDRMPMEQDADERATQVGQQLALESASSALREQLGKKTVPSPRGW